MDPATLRIGLLWHSASSGNLGVGALTIGNIAIAREVAARLQLTPRFVIMGMRDGGTPYVEGVDVFSITGAGLIQPAGCWSMMGAQDCILDIGGGDSFTDIYSPKRFAFVWATKMIAMSRRRPVIFSPQTIGPFTRWPFVWLAKVAMEGARAVVTRDRASLQAVAEIAPKAKRVLSIDVAFALPYKDRSAERGGARMKVGVNVSGLLYNEAESGRNRFGLDLDYAVLTHRFIERLVARPDVEVHLIAHVVDEDPWEDDGRIADRLAARFPGAVRAPNFAGPSEAKSYLSGLDFLVGGRMHACIGAFSTGTPVVPVAYSRKFSGLFDMLDYPWVTPVKGMGTEEALAFLEDCIARRAELAAGILAGMTKVEALLDTYRAVLSSLFKDISRGHASGRRTAGG